MPATLSREALVLDLDAYRAQRAEARSRMIPIRRDRRVRLGDQLALEFENAATLQYQVQEMLYTEFAGQEPPSDADVDHELTAYGRLLPTSHELCATLFLELQDLTTVREELHRLAGIQNALWIEIGGSRVPGDELPGLDDDEHPETVSVHVVRFRFTDEQRDLFRDPAEPASLVVEHPDYADSTPLTGTTRTSLLADLAL